MKSSGIFKVDAIVAALSVLWPTMALADLSAVPYDNFDDGNYDGWTVGDHVWSPVVNPPPVFSSPQGFAVAGVWPKVTGIMHPLSVTDAMEVSFEMRATSGPSVDADMLLWSELNYPTGAVYAGYSYQGTARFVIRYDGIERLFDYGGGSLTGWHDFKWARDAEGWWSFYLDGSNIHPNFVQDSRLTSFISVDIGTPNAQVEWVRVSAVPVPGAVLLGAIGLGCANCLLRRRSAQ
ncbi:MAG: hypothetical protein A2Y76_08090 [Planctomycetes bacterium RBG_13_60_9]|nr:MAG: hypothetical protein A2Y76_08090 [Planctomycetes bacterium RBG_13_60_9]